MPELRIDPICGRRVYIAEDRAGRPSDYSRASGQPGEPASRREQCPFCAGHEAATPNAAASLVDDNGQWRVRVVPNKFPAVSPIASDSVHAAYGAHEVIIESPRHVVDLLELSGEELVAVLTMYQNRLRHWATEGRLRHALIFKNFGRDAGASLEHLHSQLIAAPYVPGAVQAELDGAERFYREHRQCVICDLIQREMAAGDRVVAAEGGWAAICAYAGRQPYETWIMPLRHAARFESQEEVDLEEMAAFMRGVLQQFAQHFDRLSQLLAYNLILHSAPLDGSCDDSYHWHWELVPRTTELAGFEWGAGVYINPVSPERAARDLRSAAT